jgi:hypothetical protein
MKLVCSTLNLPKMRPISDPMVQKMIECHSTLIFMKMMQKPPLAVPMKKVDERAGVNVIIFKTIRPKYGYFIKKF